ncbi:hypothetical protein BWQ96_08958 [Gracilariopsis chorda]|uniref:Uncharacterized protein n=1 Tax=Gracilariopsis chorda TaxID=448386 RepID=A0A2V3IH48_9FLOR|nr:hypothetical protein BWQ96_08958 [Gracilariopsis chorda]|eukprot:PXF41343.1 hypothetical protein BWQ96_08958 [Gracilariopsis chorda]
MSDHSSTTRRCLGEVATVLIAQDGGRANIVAKTLATLWYILILPDAQARFHRQVYRKRLPWYAPGRVFGLMLSAANIATMPLSWVLLFAGRRNASRVACFSVLLNPPTITLSSLIVRELSSALVRKAYRIGLTSADVITKPFKSKESSNTKTSSNSTATTASSTTDSTKVTRTETPATQTTQPEKNGKS